MSTKVNSNDGVVVPRMHTKQTRIMVHTSAIIMNVRKMVFVGITNTLHESSSPLIFSLEKSAVCFKLC